jgi:hypothetical protein
MTRMIPVSADDAKPAVLQHCEAIYSRMREAGQTVDEDGVVLVYWQGYMTHLVKDLNLATPYYTQCKQALVKMGCIRQLKRGGGRSESQWELIKAPNADLYAEYTGGRKNKPKTVSPDRMAMVEGQIADLTRRMDVLTRNHEQLIEILNAQGRMSA